jgi:hypothetical protein
VCITYLAVPQLPPFFCYILLSAAGWFDWFWSMLSGLGTDFYIHMIIFSLVIFKPLLRPMEEIRKNFVPWPR